MDNGEIIRGFKDYLAERDSSKGDNLNKRTRRMYSADIALLAEQGVQLADVCVEDLQRALEQRNYSKATVFRKFVSLNALFKFLGREKLSFGEFSKGINFKEPNHVNRIDEEIFSKLVMVIGSKKTQDSEPVLRYRIARDLLVAASMKSLAIL